jgi:membrane-bound lytic murein transglycosylase D
MSYAKEHNLYPSVEVPYFGQCDTTLVKQQISFDQLNMWLGIDREIVEFLNPSYKIGIIPHIEGQKHYLVLPTRHMGLFIDNEDSLYVYASAAFGQSKPTAPTPTITETTEERLVHKVKSGESLTGIANKYGVTVDKVKRWNNLKKNTIHPGQRLAIYKTKDDNGTEKVATTATTKTNAESTKYYVVQKGDTLYSISRRYPGVSADDLGEWNNIKGGNIVPGMKLVVQKGQSAN